MIAKRAETLICEQRERVLALQRELAELERTPGHSDLDAKRKELQEAFMVLGMMELSGSADFDRMEE